MSSCALGANTQCVSGVPGLFEGAIGLSTYSTGTCTGNPIEQFGWPNNICVQVGSDSYTAFCSGSTMVLIYFTQTNVCFGTGYYQTFAGNACRALVRRAQRRRTAFLFSHADRPSRHRSRFRRAPTPRACSDWQRASPCASTSPRRLCTTGR